MSKQPNEVAQVTPSSHQLHVLRRMAHGYRITYPTTRLVNGDWTERCSIITAIAMRRAGWIALEQKEVWHDPPKGMTREEWGEVYRWQEYEITDAGRRMLAKMEEQGVTA
jgi:hypothetical protein